MTSGGVTDIDDWAISSSHNDDDDSLSIQPFEPSKECLQRIAATCPHVNKLSLLVRDHTLAKIAKEFKRLPIEELEAHVTWEGWTGLDVFATTLQDTLTTIDLTILEGYSWSTVMTLGQFCPNLMRLRLNLWAADSITDAETLVLQERRFPSLTDFSVRCLDPASSPSSVPEVLLFVLLGSSSGSLRTAQYQAPIAWLKPEHLEIIIGSGMLKELQMLVLNNTCTSDRMNLGLQTVDEFLEACPELCALGNLRTWSAIDYFNPESEHFYRSESNFCKLKEKAVANNWDIDFEVENIDIVFEIS